MAFLTLHETHFFSLTQFVYNNYTYVHSPMHGTSPVQIIVPIALCMHAFHSPIYIYVHYFILFKMNRLMKETFSEQKIIDATIIKTTIGVLLQ